jgi:hypothetical protein
MKEVSIRNNYTLEQHQHKLRFDGLPLVVALIRYEEKSGWDNLPASQMAQLRRMLTDRFGHYGFNAIWVIEEAPSHRDAHRPGLMLTAELLKAGYGECLAVTRLDRLTRSAKVYFDLEESVLRPLGVQLLTCRGSSGPGSSMSLVEGGGSHE